MFCHATIIQKPLFTNLDSCFSMANGLGMTPEEWEGLRAQVDRSFWVMRVIGEFSLYERVRDLI